jgi:hypothetical protein
MMAAFLILTLILAPTGRLGSAQESTPTSENAEVKADGTRKDPIPRGQWAIIGDYEVEVVGYKRNATEDVLAENMFNDPPKEGQQFTLVTLRVKYIGDEIGSLSQLDVKAVGKSNVAYDQGDCGVIPNVYYDVSDIFPDGEVKANWCFAVNSSDAKSLLIYISSYFDFKSDPIFFDPVKRDE